ncbi:hypothetical protein [Bacillus massiliigorillae]|uniref:hypothetical protein n=1 Tax=Bacillus massiliigorillae TaxID=1243664 RepID=UPI00039D79E0|nr:hypothetical protein [Bacillus massiliigorillae]
MLYDVAKLLFEQVKDAFEQNEDVTPYIYFENDTFHLSLEDDYLMGGKAIIFYPHDLMDVVNQINRQKAITMIQDKIERYYQLN